mmetsp:Transcript_14869/g.47826  ORF Transcript_14869/g.47826 Transcript_14869/m.47826 type:complete len:252 (-) Transcript_14869:285-1040(-)
MQGLSGSRYGGRRLGGGSERGRAERRRCCPGKPHTETRMERYPRDSASRSRWRSSRAERRETSPMKERCACAQDLSKLSLSLHRVTERRGREEEGEARRPRGRRPQASASAAEREDIEPEEEGERREEEREQEVVPASVDHEQPLADREPRRGQPPVRSRELLQRRGSPRASTCGAHQRGGQRARQLRRPRLKSHVDVVSVRVADHDQRTAASGLAGPPGEVVLCGWEEPVLPVVHMRARLVDEPREACWR